jgi:hypothetical protein
MFPRAPEPSAPATSGLCACELPRAGTKFPMAVALPLAFLRILSLIATLRWMAVSSS